LDISYQKHITGFEQSELLDEIKEKKIEMLRTQFVSDYSLQTIRNMKIDEYINGKGDRSTFCNRIETELKEWGNMKGAFATKFGVYYGTFGTDTNKEYRFVKKFGDTVEDAFYTIKNEIINLIKAGETKDFDKINSNLISPMLKGKILSIYYPKDYLNIFSSSHLDFFINQLNLGLIEGLTEIDKQNLLLKYKNSDLIMRGWSNYKFGKFLYYLFGSPTNDNVKGVINTGSSKTVVELFPSLNKVKYEVIELSTRNIHSNNSTNVRNKNGKVDFEEKHRNYKRIGDRGELVVLKSEIDKLKKLGKAELVSNIKHVSKDNDSAGYDILSFDEAGNEIYIEVKSTKSKQGDANFYISANELERSKGDMNYWIYVVFEVHTVNPKIWRINNPFENNKDDIVLKPVTYRVSIGVEGNSSK